MKKQWVILLGFLLVFGMPLVGQNNICSAQEEKVLSRLSGEVVKVDPQESTVVLKYLPDETQGTYAEETFSLSEALVVLKGSETAALSDLVSGDKVSLEFSTDEAGKKVVEKVQIEIK
jgi:hypothetical protein